MRGHLLVSQGNPLENSAIRRQAGQLRHHSGLEDPAKRVLPGVVLDPPGLLIAWNGTFVENARSLAKRLDLFAGKDALHQEISGLAQIVPGIFGSVSRAKCLAGVEWIPMPISQVDLAGLVDGATGIERS